MAPPDFNKVVELVKALKPAEQWRLRDLLEFWLLSPWKPSTEEELLEEMFRRGEISHFPSRQYDPATYPERPLVEIKGKPLSETVIEERR